MHSDYPQYRKYTNNLAYFKLISASEWEEIRVLGNKLMLHQFKAAILPDRNYIHDMTYAYENHWVAITASEYEQYRKQVTAQID
jgi:hypothetical protein